MSMIKNANQNHKQFKKIKITTYHFNEEADDRSNVRKKIVFQIGNKMMMKVMQYQLENFMRRKVLNKHNNLLIQKYLNVQ